jgi:hypothetical protein
MEHGFAKLARGLDAFPAIQEDLAFFDQRIEKGLVAKLEGICLSLSNAARVYFNSISANAALSERWARAISGSIIENSTKWRLVFEFSARNVGPTDNEGNVVAC